MVVRSTSIISYHQEHYLVECICKYLHGLACLRSSIAVDVKIATYSDGNGWEPDLQYFDGMGACAAISASC